MSKGKEAPVFIVGPSRSGTTLLAACLSSTPDLQIGAESHYFEDLRLRMKGRERSPLSAAEAAACETYFMALAHGVYGTEDARNWTPADDTPRARVDRNALRARAAELGPGSDAWFEAFCRLQAEALGKQRWGEKTPRHVFRIAEILERWPEAQIVCMVRDPRAVVSSYLSFAGSAHQETRRLSDKWTEWAEVDRKRIARSQHSALLALLWYSAIRASLDASRRYGEQVVVVSYEDLVSRPEETLRVLATRLQLPFSPDLIQRVPRMNSSFQDREANAGLSDASIDRWRDHLPRPDLAVVQAICRKPMRELGYSPIEVPGAPLHVARSFASLPGAILRAIHANRGRIAHLPSYLMQRLSLRAARTR